MRYHLVAALACFSFTLAGADPPSPWPPIPAEVWAMKDGNLPEGAGAVNLTRRFRMTDRQALHEYRIRICSERGKRAAEFSAFPVTTQGLRGRVVYPDGTELSFDSQKDFHAGTVLSTSDRDFQEKVLVPPGITDNCLVDLHWEELRTWQIPGRQRGYQELIDLATPFPTLEVTVEVGRLTCFSWAFSPGAGAKVSRSDTPQFLGITLKDVPAASYAPYSLKVARNIPRLKCYSQSSYLIEAARKGAAGYWAAVVDLYKNFYVEDMKKGDSYKAFSAEMLKGLSTEPQALAQELALRLQMGIRNLDQLTLRERAASTRKEADELIRPNDLEAAVRRGTAHSTGIFTLYFSLLRDAGIQPLLAFVEDRENGVLSQAELNINQLDGILFGIDGLGKPRTWLDPAMRFAPPTLILPNYQATLALVVDSSTWHGKVEGIQSQPPSTNVRQDVYRLELLPDLDKVMLETTFRGYDDYAERWACVALEPKEQDRKLRDFFEGRFGAVVDRVQVLNAADIRKPIQWQVEARLDRAAGRRRRVDPFPLTPYALSASLDLPETRTDAIVVPYLMERHAVSRFRLPPGYRFTGLEPYARSNEFGSVTLKAQLATASVDPEVEATLDVNVVLPIAGGTHWAAFREFLGWIREAGTTSLILERKP